MAHVTYEVVEHDGGWAYRLGDVLSETFATHAEAHDAAEAAAARQQLEGETEFIEYEDEEGKWHREVAAAGDRPEADVEDADSPPSLSRDVGAEEPLPEGPRGR